MSKLAPKGFFDYILIIFMVIFFGLIIYTLATGDSPFDQLGLDPMWTTIATGGVIVLIGVIYRLTRK
ncbi:MAG: hypothetical protein H6581_07095 [Bacteroidia bacterium]|nr:hypothetical protein [Bacteroidia bacterium]